MIKQESSSNTNAYKVKNSYKQKKKIGNINITIEIISTIAILATI